MILSLFALLLILNAIDAVQTIRALSAGGYGEINSLGQILFKRLGLTGGALAFKWAILIAVAVVDYLAPTVFGLALTVPLIGWGLFAVIHNYRITKGS